MLVTSQATLLACAGSFLEWDLPTVEDALGYAERRLGGTGPNLDSTIEPKDHLGMWSDEASTISIRRGRLECSRRRKIYTGIGWQDPGVLDQEPIRPRESARFGEEDPQDPFAQEQAAANDAEALRLALALS